MYEIEIPYLFAKCQKDENGNAVLQIASRTKEIFLHIPYKYIRTEIDGDGLKISRQGPVASLIWEERPYIGRIFFNIKPEMLQLYHISSPIVYLVPVELDLSISEFNINLKILLFDIGARYYNIVLIFYFPVDAESFISDISNAVLTEMNFSGFQVFILSATSPEGIPPGLYRLMVNKISGTEEVSENINVISHALLKINW